MPGLVIALIIVCILFGLAAIGYVIWRLTQYEGVQGGYYQSMMSGKVSRKPTSPYFPAEGFSSNTFDIPECEDNDIDTFVHTPPNLAKY